MQTDTLVNIWKENIGSFQSTRCNEVWNRKKDEVTKIGLTKNLLQCKTKLQIQKSQGKKQIKAHQYFRHMLN